MHRRLEIIMPRSNNIEKDIELLLKEFYKGDEENTEAFYDWYQVGGRWSGQKITDSIDDEKMQKFRQLLVDEKITVSGIIFGKESLSPESQIPIVDALWMQEFPDSPFAHCPLFEHAGKKLPGDIMDFKDIKDFSCARIIFAYKEKGKMKMSFMLQSEFWNGNTWQDAVWDGSFIQAMEMFTKKHKNCNPDYIAQITPKNHWIVVTIDYHS